MGCPTLGRKALSQLLVNQVRALSRVALGGADDPLELGDCELQAFLLLGQHVAANAIESKAGGL